MNNTTIDEVSIEINSKSEKASTGLDKLKEKLNNITGPLDNSTKRLKKLDKALTGLKIAGFTAILSKIGQKLGGFIKETNSYIETLNLFNVSFGELANSASEFANKFSGTLGVDIKDVQQYMSAFYNLANGFGVASDKAFLMSKNLTQLSYDLSSFYNISQDDAMKKLKSGLSGEIEPMRALGVALDQATLQETAHRLGIEQKVSTMTRAQKAQLSYYQIMTQTTKAQGDMSRTLLQPQNALRVLQNEFTQLARAIGSIFLPMLMAIIPYVKVVVQWLTVLAQSIAKLFGFDLGKWSSGSTKGLSNLSGGLGDVVDNAGAANKQLDKMLNKFDDLNVIDFGKASGSGAGASAGTGGDLGIELPEYDALAGALSQNLEEVEAKLKRILPIIITIGTALLAWKIGTKIIEFLKFIGVINLAQKVTALQTLAKILGGLTLLITGTSVAAMSFFDMWDNGMSLAKVALMGFGIALAAVGAIILGISAPIAITVAAIVGLVAVIALATKEFFGHRDGVLSVKDAQEQYNKAVENAQKAQEDYENAVDSADSAMQRLKNAQDKTGQSGEDLFKKVQDGTLDYKDLTSEQKELYKAYINNETEQQKLKEATDKLNQAKKEETKASIENQLAIAKESGNYDTLKTSVIEAMNQGKISAEDARDYLERAMADMSGDAKQTFLTDIPGDIKEGIDPDKYDSNWTKFKNWFGEKWTNMNTVVSDWFNNYVKPWFSPSKWIELAADAIFAFKRKFEELDIKFKLPHFKWTSTPVSGWISNVLSALNLPTSLPKLNVEWYADGGFPDEGQMFIAREAGPELVGNIGNRAAVANNDQIVEGIAQASYEGVSQALRENSGKERQPVNVYIGNDKVYSGYGNYATSQNNMFGTNVVRV